MMDGPGFALASKELSPHVEGNEGGRPFGRKTMEFLAGNQLN
jgi:hypothetical protein